jgi:hypothetical protein
MLLTLMIERVLSCDTHHWQNYWVFSDVYCQLEVMSSRAYESWNCTTLQLANLLWQTWVIASAQYLCCCGYCQPENKCMCIKWVIITQKFERLHIILWVQHMSPHNTIRVWSLFPLGWCDHNYFVTQCPVIRATNLMESHWHIRVLFLAAWTITFH